VRLAIYGSAFWEGCLKAFSVTVGAVAYLKVIKMFGFFIMFLGRLTTALLQFIVSVFVISVLRTTLRQDSIGLVVVVVVVLSVSMLTATGETACSAKGALRHNCWLCQIPSLPLRFVVVVVVGLQQFLPLPFSPFPSPSLRSRPLNRGLGRIASGKRTLCILAL